MCIRQNLPQVQDKLVFDWVKWFFFQIYFTGGEIESLAIFFARPWKGAKKYKFENLAKNQMEYQVTRVWVTVFQTFEIEKAGLNLTTNTLAALCTFNS